MSLNSILATTLPLDDKTAVRPSNEVLELRQHFVKVLKEMDELDTITIPKEMPEGARQITQSELDALEWARDFMNRYEKKHDIKREV